jgi:hydroxymethylbilane synthase
MKREDCRDLLLFKKSSLLKLRNKEQIQIFSSSPRRQYNLTPFLEKHLPFGPHKIQFLPVRGNIQTRVLKLLRDPKVDGLIVAKAAIDRLLAAEREEFQATKTFLQQSLLLTQWMVLPLSENPTAAAQGALAIEVLKTRDDLKKYLQKIQDSEAFECVQKERGILSSYGGGCHQKIGVSCFNRQFSQVTFLKGLTDKGEILKSQPTLEIPGLYVVKSDDFFTRQTIKASVPDSFSAVFVSHYEAWIPAENKVIWSSGLKTWQKLAELGIWVHGSSEGLGESEDRRLEVLAPELKWAKLSHQSPAPTELPVISTYQLIPKQNAKLPEANAYYWKSFLLYQQALKLHADLAGKKHYCGPGKTFEEIKKVTDSITVLFPMPTAKGF